MSTGILTRSNERRTLKQIAMSAVRAATNDDPRTEKEIYDAALEEYSRMIAWHGPVIEAKAHTEGYTDHEWIGFRSDFEEYSV